MLNEQNIENSGILERYITGDLSTQEVTELEALLAKNPALQKQLHSLEESFERMAQENAVTPPNTIKTEVLKSIEVDNARPTHVSKKANSYLAIAAMLAVVFGGMAFWFYTKTQDLQTEIKLANTQNEELTESIDALSYELNEIETKYAALSNPNTQKYILKGNQSLPNALAIAYINLDEKTAYVNTTKLPPLQDDKDYQMWADVNGEMINMGVLETSKELLALEFIENAASINITIEPKGGNDHATVENLVANYYITP